MKHNNIEGMARKWRRKRLEEGCAQTFLEWYNKRHETKYDLVRAEEAFPALRGGTRWEFVARQSEGDTEWIAIEVKDLLIAQAHRLFSDWSKFFKQVTRDLDCKLKGTFSVVQPPALVLNQQQQLRLRRAVLQAILEVAPRMKKDDKRDLGPQILARFPDWPLASHSEIEPQPDTMKKARQFQLRKVLDSGCSVEPSKLHLHTFNVQRVENEAVRSVFKPTSNGVSKLSEQLKVAKENGAKETVLLLDSHVSWRPESIKQTLTSIDSNLLSNVDSVYLVLPSSEVIKVWKCKYLGAPI